MQIADCNILAYTLKYHSELNHTLKWTIFLALSSGSQFPLSQHNCCKDAAQCQIVCEGRIQNPRFCLSSDSWLSCLSFILIWQFLLEFISHHPKHVQVAVLFPMCMHKCKLHAAEQSLPASSPCFVCAFQKKDVMAAIECGGRTRTCVAACCLINVCSYLQH